MAGKSAYSGTDSSMCSLVLAVNTVGQSSITMKYSIMTIRNPYDGSANTRADTIVLQYRTDTTNAFNTLANTKYANLRQGPTKTSFGDTAGQNVQTISFGLPVACENKPIVQLRWVIKDSVGSGKHPSFAIDSVSVVYSQIAYSTPVLDTVKSFRGDKKATLIWHPVNLQSLRRYWIYVDSIGLNNFGLKDSSSTGKNPNDTVKVMTALTDYKTYRFKVAAVDTNGVVSSLSNAFTVVPVDSIPPKIQINSVRAGNGRVYINWSKDRPATNIQFYRIYSGTSATSTIETDSTLSSNPNDTTRTYSTLANNTTYTFALSQ